MERRGEWEREGRRKTRVIDREKKSLRGKGRTRVERLRGEKKQKYWNNFG